VSPSTWAIFLVIYLYWVVYATLSGLVPLLVSSCLSLVAIVVVLAQVRARIDGRAAAVFAASTVVVALALVASAELAVWLSGGLAVALRFPQIRQLVVARSTIGVSAVTWAVATVMNALWVVYGIAEQAFAFAAVNAAIGTTSFTVLALTVWRAHTATESVA
jgi:hypothetical protein